MNTLTVDDVDLIRKNLNYARRSVFPKLPKTIDDQKQLTNFLLVNNKSDNTVLVSTISKLIFLYSLSTIFVDGTFYTCPK